MCGRAAMGADLAAPLAVGCAGAAGAAETDEVGAPGGELGGGVGRAAGVTEAAGGGATGGAGTVNTGLAVVGGRTTFGGGAAGAEGAEAGAFAAGFVAAGFVSTGGTAAGRVGGAVTATGACCFRMASRTSPGLEMWERSILVLISSAAVRLARAGLVAACASLDERKCARTFTASCSSKELECVFFSVTPTSSSTSRIALLLTSSSLARSLIRILVIRPFSSSGLSR